MSLRLSFCSPKAAAYAVENWHYSRSMPNAGVKIGVWEDEHFIGAVLFGVGAGNSTRGERYGLKRSHEVAELLRVALREHKAPVSKIVAIAIGILRKQSPNLKMLISFADEYAQGHLGTIYQAGNWIYAGTFTGDGGFVIHGKVVHSKTVHSNRWKQSVSWIRAHLDPKCVKAKTVKHRYLYPLTDEMRARLKPFAKPYPKQRAFEVNRVTSGLHPGEGGSTPTRTLQSEAEAVPA